MIGKMEGVMYRQDKLVINNIITHRIKGITVVIVAMDCSNSSNNQ